MKKMGNPLSESFDSQGIKPNASTYNAYLEVLGGSGQIQEMIQMFTSAKGLLLGDTIATTTFLKHISKQVCIAFYVVINLREFTI